MRLHEKYNGIKGAGETDNLEFANCSVFQDKRQYCLIIKEPMTS